MASSSARRSPGRSWIQHIFLGRSRPRPIGAGWRERRRWFRPRLEILEDRTLFSVSLSGLPAWTAQGPAPNTNGGTFAGGGNVIGPTAAQSLDVGAINAIAVDPNNAKHLFAASVNGGIWQTSDFTTANPIWTTTTDQMPSLAIESIAFSPVNSNVIYAGTGSYSSIYLRPFGADTDIAGQGGGAVGVYKSSDGGATWQVENPNGIFSGLRIIRMIPTSLNGGQTVFAATTDGGSSGGVFRSDDGGTSWTRLSGANGLPNSGVTDLVENPSNPNQFFAATSNTIAGAGAGVYELDATGGNTNWVNVTNNMVPGDVSGSERIELVISPAGVNPIWASIINAQRRDSNDNVTTPGEFYQRVYRGVAGNGTVNWTQVGPSGQPPDILTGNQGAIHGAIAADPTSDTLVYVSGDRINSGNAGTTGYVVRGDSTANTWTAITPAGSSSGDAGTVVPTSNSAVQTSPHADSRGMVFAAGGVLLYSSDGGVYQATSPSSGNQIWTSINGTIQDTEFYNVSYDSQFHIIFGGAQDNGTPSQNAPNVTNSYHDESGGDGGATAVDNISLAGMGESDRYFFGDVRKIFNGANSRAPGDNDANILPSTGLAGLTSATANDLFSFSVVNSVAGRIVVAGGTNKTTTVGALYESSDAGTGSETKIGTSFFVNDTWTQIPTGAGFVRASAMAAGGTLNGIANPDVLYVASGNQIFLRTTAGGTLTATSGQPAFAGTIVSIALDPNNWQTAFVTDATNVYMTTDAGAHWTNVTGNLTNPPGARGAPAFLSVIPGTGQDAVLFGGTKGVFRMLTNTPSVWTTFAPELPNAFTGGMVYSAADDTLVDATYGRGAWKLANASTIAFATEGAANSFGLGSFTDSNVGPWTVDVNWGDGTPDTTFSVTTQGSLGTKSHTYGEEGTYTVTETVTDTADNQSDTQTFQVPVTDPTIAATGGFNVSATEGALSSLQTVATFIDPGGAEPNSSDPSGGISAHYTASIDWGDGSLPSTGVITFANNTFTVSGSHIYGEEGSYTITAIINHENSVPQTVTSMATVNDPPVMAAGVPVFGVECRTLTVPVATFIDPGGAEPNPSDPSGTINNHYQVVSIDWGDSTPLDTTSGTLTYSGAPGSTTDPFTVSGSHAYLHEGTYTITTTLDHEGIFTTTTTTAIIKDDLGLLLLDPTDSKSLMVTGNGVVDVTGCGAVVVDSSDGRAAFLSGHGTVTAEDIDVTGGFKTAGQAGFSGPVDTEAATPDPLGLTLPAPPSPTFAAVHYSGSAALTLLPGTYVGGITITGSGPVTLAPGVYYMQGGGFSVGGKGSVSGTGVTIINAPGATGGAISVSGQGNVNLTAPTSGPFQGIVLFQDPASANTVQFTGQAVVTLTGVAYVPAALVSIDGNANVTINAGPGTAVAPPPILGALIAFDLKIDGNGVLTINPDDPPSGPMMASSLSAAGPASAAELTSAGPKAVSLTALDTLMSGGGTQEGGDLSTPFAIPLSESPQSVGNNPSLAQGAQAGTSAVNRTVLDQLFSGTTGALGKIGKNPLGSSFSPVS